MSNGQVLVYFLDSSAVAVDITPTTLVDDVLSQVQHKIGLQCEDGGFAIYELVRGGQHYLKPGTHITEVGAP